MLCEKYYINHMLRNRIAKYSHTIGEHTFIMRTDPVLPYQANSK